MNHREIRVENAKDKYSELIWSWRNDQKTREMSKNKELISWEDHSIWFRDSLKSPNKIIFIGFYNQNPVGIVSFNAIKGTTDQYIISINVSPQERGKGIGKALLSKSIRKLKTDFPLSNKLFAHVRKENSVSNILFKKIGFKLINSDEEDYFIFFRKIEK